MKGEAFTNNYRHAKNCLVAAANLVQRSMANYIKLMCGKNIEFKRGRIH